MALQWVWSHVFFASWGRAYFSLFNLDGTLQYSTKRMGYVVPKAGSSKAVGFMPGSPPGLALGTQPSCCGEAQGFRVIASISHRMCGRRGTVNLLMSPALAFQPPQLIPHRADRVPTEHWLNCHGAVMCWAFLKVATDNWTCLTSPSFIILAALLLVAAHGLFSCSMFPEQGLNLGPLHWDLRDLATGPPGKSLLFISYSLLNLLQLDAHPHHSMEKALLWPTFLADSAPPPKFFLQTL